MLLGTTKVKFIWGVQIRRGVWLIKVTHSEGSMDQGRVGRVVGVLGSEAGFAGSMLN